MMDEQRMDGSSGGAPHAAAEPVNGPLDTMAAEYVIRDPRTPMPWMNYLFNDTYCALVSATGGGYSFQRCARDRRLLRYRLNNLPADRPGRYFYVRRRDTGAYWSAGWAPVQRGAPDGCFECRHGLGYTCIRHQQKEVDQEILYVVPRNADLELWRLRLTNRAPRAVALSVFSYAEFCLYQAEHDLSNFQYTFNIARCRALGSVIQHETWTRRYGLFTFQASSLPPVGWDCDREQFMGTGRGEHAPRAVEQGACTNSTCLHGNPIAAFQVDFELAPGETREWVLALGFAEQPQEDTAARLAAPWLQPGAVERALREVRAHWQEQCEHFVVETPDAGMNTVLNGWHPYQAQTTFRLSRGPSIYEGGIRRGLGFRDSCQDTLGVLHAEAPAVRRRLLQLAANQFVDGRSRHQFFPLSGQGAEDHCWDTHLWLVLALCAYLRETGDWDLLAEEAPFVDGDPAPVAAHLAAAVDFSLAHLGAHGLPRLGRSDWNDCLQLPGPNGGAESVFIACQLAGALRELAALAAQRGAVEHARHRLEQAEELSARINAVAWDGEWYARAFDDYGRAVGTSGNAFGRIFLNAQTWSIMAGVAAPERARRALAAVARWLDSPFGPRLLNPPWEEFDPAVGALSDMPAGLKENGGVFCQAVAWAVIAAAQAGAAEQAWRYYRQLLPGHAVRPAAYEAEPYVYAQMIIAPPHPRAGTARNSWLTGTAA
ncbi:MAG: glycosyl transferase, partial [Candidatus Marinimicrobia bacterium]|nr:glycosyl transferase [Candidatus Neomarinimicrobiota bacterium]